MTEPTKEGIVSEREKLYSEACTTSNQPRFGYFGYAPPLCIGDAFVKAKQHTGKHSTKSEERNMPFLVSKQFSGYSEQFRSKGSVFVGCPYEIAKSRKKVTSKESVASKESEDSRRAAWRPSSLVVMRDALAPQGMSLNAASDASAEPMKPVKKVSHGKRGIYAVAPSSRHHPGEYSTQMYFEPFVSTAGSDTGKSESKVSEAKAKAEAQKGSDETRSDEQGAEAGSSNDAGGDTTKNTVPKDAISNPSKGKENEHQVSKWHESTSKSNGPTFKLGAFPPIESFNRFDPTSLGKEQATLEKPKAREELAELAKKRKLKRLAMTRYTPFRFGIPKEQKYPEYFSGAIRPNKPVDNEPVSKPTSKVDPASGVAQSTAEADSGAKEAKPVKSRPTKEKAFHSPWRPSDLTNKGHPTPSVMLNNLVVTWPLRHFSF